MRLTEKDLKRITIAQGYFARQRVPVHVPHAEVVRIALRRFVEELGEHDEEVAKARLAVEHPDVF